MNYLVTTRCWSCVSKCVCHLCNKDGWLSLYLYFCIFAVLFGRQHWWRCPFLADWLPLWRINTLCLSSWVYAIIWSNRWIVWCRRYIVWENLLYLLSEHQAKDEVYLGRIIQFWIPHGYMAGGAGYIISKPGVQLIIDQGPNFPADCPKDGAIEDIAIGR